MHVSEYRGGTRFSCVIVLYGMLQGRSHRLESGPVIIKPGMWDGMIDYIMYAPK